MKAVFELMAAVCLLLVFLVLAWLYEDEAP